MKLYFEMYSGISGDMTIGALLDLGASREKLENAIKSLNITGYELSFSRTKKNGIDAYNFDVELHNHSHEHRNLKDVYEIIDRGDFNDNIKNNAKKIFDIIVNSESKAHNIDKNEVHFHEVGAIDSIIDIVGVSVLLDDLNVEEIYFSDLYDGKGYQKCAHGMMPVPVPAVLNIVNAHNLKLNIIDDMGEHITPTGAAIVANFNKGYKLEDFTIKKIGLGAGNKDFANTTNILRVMEIETDKKKQ
ncbi:LarC family nickel insertion protein [Peptoanaerobacter stomatis]